MSTLTPLSEVEMLLDLWKYGPSYTVIPYKLIKAFKSEKCNKTLSSVQCMGFDTFSCFFSQIGHYWMP